MLLVGSLTWKVISCSTHQRKLPFQTYCYIYSRFNIAIVCSCCFFLGVWTDLWFLFWFFHACCSLVHFSEYFRICTLFFFDKKKATMFFFCFKYFPLVCLIYPVTLKTLSIENVLKLDAKWVTFFSFRNLMSSMTHCQFWILSCLWSIFLSTFRNNPKRAALFALNS